MRLPVRKDKAAAREIVRKARTVRHKARATVMVRAEASMTTGMANGARTEAVRVKAVKEAMADIRITGMARAADVPARVKEDMAARAPAVKEAVPARAARTEAVRVKEAKGADDRRTAIARAEADAKTSVRAFLRLPWWRLRFQPAEDVPEKRDVWKEKAGKAASGVTASARKMNLAADLKKDASISSPAKAKAARTPKAKATSRRARKLTIRRRKSSFAAK